MSGGSSSSSESEEVEGRFACALEPGGAAGTGVGWTVAMITYSLSGNTTWVYADRMPQFVFRGYFWKQQMGCLFR
jgi:hypothetical protein